MKSIMKYNYLLLLFIAWSVPQACKQKAAETHDHTTATDHQHVYLCPMNCEKGKSYDQSGKCPVCGMALELKVKPTEQLNYKMAYASTPPQIDAGKSATLSFTPQIVGRESDQLALDVQHERKIHLIVVSEDLSYFEHIHPVYQADGSYLIKVLDKGKALTNGKGHDETYFAQGGNYTLFADYLPSGGAHQVEKINITVNGPAKTAVTYHGTTATAKSGDFQMKLDVQEGKWITNAPLHISAALSKQNKSIDVNTLENYLGAKAHMVVISLKDKTYLHVHPDVHNGSFDLHTTFKESGLHRGWIQFQSEGKLYTLDFVLDVTVGSTEDIEKASKEDHSNPG